VPTRAGTPGRSRSRTSGGDEDGQQQKQLLDDVDRGNVTLNIRVEDENDVFDRLAKRLVYGLLGAGGAVATALLYTSNGATPPTAVAGVATAAVILLLYRSFRKRRGIRAVPQFTRQNMRRRREE